MRLFRHTPGWLACLALVVTAAVVRAEAPPSPLRLVPNEADLLIQVDNPRRLAETFTTLEVFQQFQQLDAVRELYDSTNYRRFLQLVDHFEKQFGVAWPELLDRIGGGGVAVAVKIGPQPAPALFVLQGKDEESVRKFATLALEVVEQELARQESKERIAKSNYRGVETLRVGKEAHAAVAGSAMLFSNKEDALHRALDLHLDGGKNSLANVSAVAESRKLLPADPLVSLWLNLDTVHKAPQAKDLFTLPRNDANLTAIAGGLLDVAGRAPFLCAGLHRDKDGILATIRMPRGRDGMPSALGLHVPLNGQPGSLALLQPKGTILSLSYYLDISKVWEERSKLFNEAQAKAIEDFDKNSGRFLIGTRFSQLSAQAGPHQRLVIVHHPRSSSEKVTPLTLPRDLSGAFVVDVRDPAFGKNVEAVLRGAALLAGTQVKLKLVEEKYNGVDLVGYLVQEVKTPRGTPGPALALQSPCFATVGDQFFVASSLELGRELIDLLQQEAKDPKKKKGNVAASRLLVRADTGAEVLRALEDNLLVGAILDRAVPPDEARAQVRSYIDWVRRLGSLQTKTTYNANDFNVDIRLKLAK